jgi:hypothetical protein
MDANEALFGSVIQHLELSPGDEKVFCGRYRGFPIAVQALPGERSIGLLFHVRHPLDDQSLPAREYHYGDEVDGLIADGKAEVSVEGKIAWLTLYEIEQAPQDETALGLLDAVLDEWEEAGLCLGDLCQDCRKESVESVSYHKGRVAQICPACMDIRVRKAYQSLAGNSKNRVILICMCLIAILVASLAWTALWIGFDAMIALLTTKGRGG